MSKLTNFIGLVAVLAVLLVPMVVDAEEFKGMSYVGWGRSDLATAQSDEAIREMSELGVNMVALNVFWFQDTKSSHEIYPDYYAYSADMDSLAHAINEIHSRGMRVMLKPNLDIRHPEKGEWRGVIEPDNMDAWFTNYEKYILTMAELAEEKNVEILSVGTELNGVERHNYHWRRLIARVRGIYSGELIYAANHGPVGWRGGGYKEVEFWDELDYIGIDAYHRLSRKLDPDVVDMVRAWQKIREDIKEWRSENGYEQPVIFTEVGFRSINRAVATPWNYEKDGVLDLEEQAEAYEALLIAFHGQDWWGGAMWWYWSKESSADSKYDRGFTPNGKPAGEILRRYYYEEPDVLREEEEVAGRGLSGWKIAGLFLMSRLLTGVV